MDSINQEVNSTDQEIASIQAKMNSLSETTKIQSDQIQSQLLNLQQSTDESESN